MLYAGAFTTKLEVFPEHYEALLSFGLPLFLSCRYFERELKVIPESLAFSCDGSWLIGWLDESIEIHSWLSPCEIYAFLNMVWGIYLTWKNFLNDFDILHALLFYYNNCYKNNRTSTMCPFSPTVGVQDTRSRTAQNSIATRLAVMQWICKLLDDRTWQSL
jgi:hypothetical protein